jgi:hypothetical protein
MRGLEIGLAGRGSDFRWDDGTSFDPAEFSLKGRNNGLEGTPVDMLTALNSESVSHGCHLFVRRVLRRCLSANFYH